MKGLYNLSFGTEACKNPTCAFPEPVPDSNLLSGGRRGHRAVLGGRRERALRGSSPDTAAGVVLLPGTHLDFLAAAAESPICTAFGTLDCCIWGVLHLKLLYLLIPMLIVHDTAEVISSLQIEHRVKAL